MRRGGHIPDVGRVGRTLGLENGVTKTRVKYELEVLLCTAFDMHPVDAGV